MRSGINVMVKLSCYSVLVQESISGGRQGAEDELSCKSTGKERFLLPAQLKCEH